MKVLLLRDVKGIGRKMEIKEVKDGYAKNFLISKGIAAPVSEDNLKLKKDWDTKKELTSVKIDESLKSLQGLALEFGVKSGDKGEVFYSIGENEIKKEVEKMGFANFKIVIERPIKKLGESQALLSFGKGREVIVKVILKPLR